MKKIPKLNCYLQASKRLSLWRVLWLIITSFGFAKFMAQNRFIYYADKYKDTSFKKSIPQLETEALEELADYLNYILFIDIIRKEGQCQKRGADN